MIFLRIMFRQIPILDMRSRSRFLKLFLDVLSIHGDIFLQELLGLKIRTVKGGFRECRLAGTHDLFSYWFVMLLKADMYCSGPWVL